MYNLSHRSRSETPQKYEIQKNLDSYYVENGTTLCSTDFLMQQISERRCKMMPCRNARIYFLKWKNQINHESPLSLLNLRMFSLLFLDHLPPSYRPCPRILSTVFKDLQTNKTIRHEKSTWLPQYWLSLLLWAATSWWNYYSIPKCRVWSQKVFADSVTKQPIDG